MIITGAWWLSGRIGALRPEGRRFESRSGHHVGTLRKFLAHNALHYNKHLRRRGVKVHFCACHVRYEEERRYQSSVVLYCIE